MSAPDVIIVGAGPAGLACAAAMRRLRLNAMVLEKVGTVGSVWRSHYDRLHLHTDRNHSGLPGMAMPRDYPTYPSRAQVVEYLEAYTRHFDTDVQRVTRIGGGWRFETNAGEFLAVVVVVATGIESKAATLGSAPAFVDLSAFPRWADRDRR